MARSSAAVGAARRDSARSPPSGRRAGRVRLPRPQDERGNSPDNLARFVHQARVRRRVVVDLIRGAKDRGHRAYKLVDMEKVKEKAARLPEDVVPAEIVALLPHDDGLDQVLIQKAAAPIPGRGSVEEVAEKLDSCRPNAVVEEKSSNDSADINAQRISALHHSMTQLRPEGEEGSKGSGDHTSGRQDADIGGPDKSSPRKVQRLAITSGSQMIDQITPMVLWRCLCNPLQVLHRHARRPGAHGERKISQRQRCATH